MRCVDAASPRVFHNWKPLVPSSATNTSASPQTVIAFGIEPRAPGSMSATRVVPAALPSLFQSSEPERPSSAAK